MLKYFRRNIIETKETKRLFERERTISGDVKQFT